MQVEGKLVSLIQAGHRLKVEMYFDEYADLEPMADLVGERIVFDISKYHKHRSLDANAYLWVLCSKMAQVLGTDKESVYLLELSRYGVFTDLQLNREALPLLKRTYRYVEEFNEGDDNSAFVRCYLGSSTYDTYEMAKLLEGVVNDARDLSVEVLPPDEIERIKQLWKNH